MSANRLVAIHQPNFFPWLGYFDKIRRCDVFVVLDDVQFARGGAGNWSNRVRLMVGGQPAWISMPVKSAQRGMQKINEVEISSDVPWRIKMTKTIRMHYAKAPHFPAVFPWLEPLIMNPTPSLVDYNLAAIRAICDALSLDTAKFRLSSTLESRGQATELLISLVQGVNGTAYLSGDGAGGYQDEQQYEEAGVGLQLQRFAHPVYPQGKSAEFVPGLSIIDALMHCGFEGVKNLLAGPA
jgi:hypothetical protein